MVNLYEIKDTKQDVFKSIPLSYSIYKDANNPIKCDKNIIVKLAESNYNRLCVLVKQHDQEIFVSIDELREILKVSEILMDNTELKIK